MSIFNDDGRMTDITRSPSGMDYPGDPFFQYEKKRNEDIVEDAIASGPITIKEVLVTLALLPVFLYFFFNL